ncbi:MAG: SDR family NAD(P)-dependent oxidoreductase, partial [Pseudomonadota bacterium]
MAQNTRTAVVTGVSSGIGRAICAQLIKDGWHVFGSVRTDEDANAARDALGNAFTPLVFDV